MNDLYPSARLPLEDGDMLAAVDLGSNSFHMVVARYLLGQLRIVDRLRETVRLAEGLDGKGGLDAAVRQRAIARAGQSRDNLSIRSCSRWQLCLKANA